MDQNNPILVNVMRGNGIESRHRGAVAIVDKSGSVIGSWGDTSTPVFPRSAVKPLQALCLLETGAAEAFNVTDEEIALASASHNAEPEHVQRVGEWLSRLGLSGDDLECGAHEPMDPVSAKELVRGGTTPDRLYNNCSGKHAGFLTTALHMGWPTKGYVQRDHPVQQQLRRVLGEMGEWDLSQTAEGVDGCGIPVLAMPLKAMARALARMASPASLSGEREAASRRVLRAMTTHPQLVAGTGRFDTLVMQACGEAVAVKTGAEGVYAAILPEQGLGVALKIDDGAKRASEMAMASVLDHLGVFSPETASRLSDALNPVISNAAGEVVGEISPARGWLSDGWI